MAELKANTMLKCKGTGNIIEVVVPNKDADAESMNIFEAKTSGEGEVKHVPVVTREADKYHVEVWEVEHPIDEEHYIALIELEADGQIHKQLLKPGDKPQADFYIPEAENVEAREFCTLHGLWKA